MKYKKVSTYLILLLLIGLLGCKKSIPQSHEEIENFQLELKKENLRTLFLGAISFCSNTNYSDFFDNPRSYEEYKNGGNCCTSSVPRPYINLSEYYIYSMEGDRSIFDNQNNPFKLKEVRKKWQKKINKVKNKAKKINPNELVYKGFENIYVNTYDLKSEQLKFGLGGIILISFDGVQGDWYGGIGFRYKGGKSPYVKGLKLSSKEAEKLFEYFEKNNRRSELPPAKQLSTIITYALEEPSHNDALSHLIVNVKKVEFFYPNGWDKKIGEVIF